MLDEFTWAFRTLRAVELPGGIAFCIPGPLLAWVKPAAGALWVGSAPREGGGPLHLCAGEEAACGYWSLPEEDLKVEEAEPSAVLVIRYIRSVEPGHEPLGCCRPKAEGPGSVGARTSGTSWIVKLDV